MNNIDIAADEKIKLEKKKLLRLALSDGEGVTKKPLSPMAQKKLAERKKKIKKVIIILAFFLLAYGIYWLFKPFEKGLSFGVCKVFIELSVPYPDSIHYSEVIEFADSVRVWYSYYDTFGDFRLQQTQCFFAPDEKYGMSVSSILVGRLEVDPEKVALFNNSLPSIFKNPPDLTYPEPLPNDIGQLKFEFEKFRQPIL
jgi:hypothetical protein